MHISADIVIALLLIVFAYLFFLKYFKTQDDNLINDIPTIDIESDRLEKHASDIADFYSKSKSSNCRKKLMRSLDKSFEKILDAYNFIDKETKNKKEIVSAAEWLLDNLYLIEKEYKDIKRNMPRQYYKGLPTICSDSLKGYPRIYHIAAEIVSHTDGKIDGNIIKKFIKSYQKKSVLSSSELWALPIMIRIALIQNISKLCEEIKYVHKEKIKSDLIAERIINAFNENKIEQELKELSKMNIEFNMYFTERLLKILRDNGVDNHNTYLWIDEKLNKMGTNSERIIVHEHQKEANLQISMGNSVSSLRKVEALNWKKYFEILSEIENILREDPLGIYQFMDFESRDYYRHRIEKLAKKLGVAETFIAKKAIEFAKNAELIDEKEYLRHVGYYLVDDGINELISNVRNNEGTIEGIKNKFASNKTGFYLGTIIIGTVFLISLFIYTSIISDNKFILWKYIIAVIALIVPCSEIVISILNWSITHLVEPCFIPKLELKNGIGEENRTVIVIPTLINSVENVKKLFENLEVYYLANNEDNLYYAVLGDFRDSINEHEKNDDEIIKTALYITKKLNEKYCKDKDDKFFFLNRYRQFNEKEELWMGWERKRGKLMEFNRLLRGKENTSYNVISSYIGNLKKAKYVITLDSDTQLPMGVAKKLIGAMAHVLNIPRIDRKKRRILRGYGIMQPRISVSIFSANKTIFSKVFSGETGIDTYTTAVSDVYQDLFKEGIFTGKGIYDIDTFLYMLDGEIPENSILSHDLLEGSYARTALVTDVELIDGYPAYYNSSAKRLHRWVRGDWQLLPWLKKQLNTLSKWKIIDNLRRSLLAPSLILIVILNLAGLLPDGTDKWFVASIVALISPILFDVSEVVVTPIKGISLSGKIKNGKMVLEQVFLIVSFLPYQAYLMVDAIVRTLYRLFISKRKLLEWQTAADIEKSVKRDLLSFIKSMWGGSIISFIIFILVLNKGTETTLVFLPTCIIWMLSPYIPYLISCENKSTHNILQKNDTEMLRRLSRKTWAYFEDFVTEKNNWLGPDNFQENPSNGLAYRTSPTNMGMGIVSNVSAYDFGYIGMVELIQRVSNIISSMNVLDKYEGHFYNWYDTRTMKPLFPRFISTVDSGNLVGYLWVTAEALRDVLNSPIVNTRCKNGILDTLKLANEELKNNTGIKDLYSNIVDEIDNSEFEITWWIEKLNYLKSKTLDVEKISNKKSFYWNYKLKHMIIAYENELNKLLPWIKLVGDYNGDHKDYNDELKNELLNLVTQIPLNKVEQNIDNLLNNIDKFNKDGEDAEEVGDAYNEYLLNEDFLNKLEKFLNEGKNEIRYLCNDIVEVISKLEEMAENIDFSILFDETRELFSIGYDMESDKLNNSYYDLLASECRQASFVAIAKGDINYKHWFKLGRVMTFMGKSKGLVSWSGTMFEYFMPLLIMKNYRGTLLDKTYEAVLSGQKKYCKERNVPWGISESAFYNFDVNLNYQYKAFGVPGIGLKRGLVNELVIAPYSSVLALLKDKRSAASNIRVLLNNGLEGRYGLYEAVDYTKERLKKGHKREVIKCFMIHHEGMSLLALDNTINENILQNRFHNIPRVKSAELLLQEKVPDIITYDREEKLMYKEFNTDKQKIVVRKYTAKTAMPETHLLSNGSYSMMISNSGSGYAKKEDIYIYRWREDVTCDSSGMFFYVKDITPYDIKNNSKKYWSVTYEPCKDAGEKYEVTFSLDKAEFERRDNDVITHTEITVSSGENAEIRKISLTNNSEKTKLIEVTSYIEVTLCGYDGDLVHPAFSNLFITTEYVESNGCLLATRRPRAKGKKQHWVMQTVLVNGETVGDIQYETSRINFIGRGNNVKIPAVITNDIELSNFTGAVLDPILSLRRKVKIKSGETCELIFITAIADSREEAIKIAQEYSVLQNIVREFDLAWTQSQVEMRYLGIKSTQANLYQNIASKILFLSPLLRNREEYIIKNKLGQSALWAYGISGDLPIVLLIVREEKDIDLCSQLLTMHEYLSLKGLKFDLVILNFQAVSYREPLKEAIMELIYSSHARDKQNKSGGVFVYNKTKMQQDDVNLLKAIARVVIDSKDGILVSQIKNSSGLEKRECMLQTKEVEYSCNKNNWNIPRLQFFNGYGGFNEEGNKYFIILKDGKNTPAPWINVISNGEFGFHVSESGASYTWCENSRENKITAWSNDWICDTPSEALYLRDDITGECWSITPKPIRDDGEYIVEHGFGYSTFKHYTKGIVSEMTMFVPMDSNVKLCKVKLKNNSDIDRRLSISYYAQLVMGVVPQHTVQHIYTEINYKKEYICSMNPYSMYFGNLYTYLKIYGTQNNTFTGNRTEFLGRGGSVEEPEVLKRMRLSNTSGAGFDPCLACMGNVILSPNEETEIIVMLGEDVSTEKIEETMEKYSSQIALNRALNDTKKYWEKLLGNIRVKTPEKSMDILINGWLMYQTLSCRIWARTAFYQSGGAYGFRDQLQDVMSLCYLEPNITREHILYSASRQFLEGDVQHWWHPVVNSGIRTRFSDDLLWLPFVTIDYIKNTGDYSILTEKAKYLKDESLKEGEDERYNISSETEIEGTIYEHCNKAIERALKFGVHNIPLMGSGDWNDGMSTVGNGGKGESVWLGWFLYSILHNYTGICRYMKDLKREEKYTKAKEFIKENLEKNAWDGKWYRRAYFDDGTALGSNENEECKIDSLSQSWAILSGAANNKRKREAMKSLEKYLIDDEHKLIKLLTPAFYKSSLEPGYIKGYVPGVRENGGQYTHAATWVVLAQTKLHNGNEAVRLYNMINPINHTLTKEQCDIYKTEPYVMTADVYSCEPYEGRGGWSWYTGTSGWMYRVGIDGILGLKLRGDRGFKVEPCIPNSWDEYEIRYTKDEVVYNIKVKRTGNKNSKNSENSISNKNSKYSSKNSGNKNSSYSYKNNYKKVILDGKIVKDNLIHYQKEGEHEVIVFI